MLNRIAGSTARISLRERRGVQACVGATKSISCRRGATPGFQFDLNYGYTMRRSVAPKRWLSDGPQSTEKIKTVKQKWLQRFLGPKPMPTRYTFQWYREVFLICTVFAITGTSTMLLVRPAMSKILGLKGSLREGPWSYRICSIVIMTPLYAILLVAVGTVFGRHAYFRHFSVKIFSRFGIPPELIDSTFHETAKTFRKW